MQSVVDLINELRETLPIDSPPNTDELRDRSRRRATRKRSRIGLATAATVAIAGTALFAIMSTGSPSSDEVLVSEQPPASPAALPETGGDGSTDERDRPEAGEAVDPSESAPVSSELPLPGSPDYRAPSIVNLRADIEYSRAVLGDVRIGDPCAEIDDAYVGDAAGPQPVLVAMGSSFDGTCTIVGWVYRLLPADIGEEIDVPRFQETYRLAPIFSDNGEVLRFMDPPDVVLDPSELPPNPEDLLVSD